MVTRTNLARLEDLGRFLSDYHHAFGNLHAWHLYRMLPVGRGGKESGPRLDVGSEAYNRACDQVRRLEPTLHILKRPNMLRSSTVGFFWMQQGGCQSMSPYKVDFPAVMP